jgi:stage IV sporulation protein FB
MNQEPAESQYDIHFQVFGFPTRVTWGFWVAAVVLGWGECNAWDDVFVRIGIDSPGAPILLVIWSIAIFLSILVHELGHALVMRRYGMQSRVVLYHFGGLAIGSGFGSWNGARRNSNDARDSLLISAAGPAAQLALAAIVYAIGRFLGMPMDIDGWLFQDFFSIAPPTVELPTSVALFVFLNALVSPSVFWALLNLLPILPLDGGNILLNTLRLSRNGDPHRNSHLISIFCASLVAIYCYQNGQPMLTMMCVMFAAINWQQLQMMSGRF